MSYIRYANQGATRNRPLSPDLVDALSFLPDLGVQMEVFSGGQPAKGGGGRVGSTRHDHGNAADAFFYKDGRRLDWSNPEDQPLFQDIVRQARSRGITGIGAGEGYMQPGSMHIGFGKEAVWGAGGSGANAPEWLRTAYSGATGSAAPSPTPFNPQATISTQGGLLAQEPEMQEYEPEKAGGLLGQIFPNMTADRRDRIMLALDGMSIDPSEGYQRAILGNMDARRDDKKAAQAQQKAQQQANRTLDVLRQMGASESDIQMAQANPDYMRAMVSQLAQQRLAKAEPIKGVELNGRLVNPYTGEEIADFSDGGDQSAAEEKLARLMEVTNPKTGQPFTRQEAIRLEQLVEVSRDPTTGSVVLIDKSTGEAIGQPSQSQQPGAAPQQSDPSSEEEIGRIEGALGGRGIANSIANAIGDAVGLGLAAPEAEQAASNLGSLSTQTMLALSGEWSGRPSNLTRERIEKLTVKPNELTMGRERALIRFKEMRDLIGNSIAGAQSVQGGNYTPQQRTEAGQKYQVLVPLLEEYNAIIEQLERGSGGGSEIDDIADKWDK